jgi:transposase-like protein
MSISKNPPCIYCKSSKVIKHGKTTTGNPRFRCRTCNRTWVLEKNEPLRPDVADITEAYLNGRTCRDLVGIYHSSPLRINQKIREFLAGCPNWEEYLDTCVEKHEPRLIYLIGRTFSSASEGSRNNTMFLGMAVDALSTVVLGYEIGKAETYNLWLTLLDRLNCRGVVCPSFMSNGTKSIEDAVNTVYPYATVRINYHRAYRDKELACCIYRLPINNKLLNDAVKIYNSLENKNLSKYLKTKNEKRIQDFLFESQEEFIKRVKDRLDNKNKIRIEGLSGSFQARFEKFHMLKDEPMPIINGWIARTMLSRLTIGFSRLSLYMQVPATTTFKNFSCGNVPTILDLKEDSPLLKTFVIEVAARSLQLPIIYNRCEMKLDKCSLF